MSTKMAVDEPKPAVSVTEPAAVLVIENECEVSAGPKVTEPLAVVAPLQSELVRNAVALEAETVAVTPAPVDGLPNASLRSRVRVWHTPAVLLAGGLAQPTLAVAAAFTLTVVVAIRAPLSLMV